MCGIESVEVIGMLVLGVRLMKCDYVLFIVLISVVFDFEDLV